MVKLKNLKRNDNLAECDIIPEDSQQVGHITVNLDSEELENFLLPADYEWCENHVQHAARTLAELMKNGEMPEEYLVMWY